MKITELDVYIIKWYKCEWNYVLYNSAVGLEF
jgi:hypothetical protein